MKSPCLLQPVTITGRNLPATGGATVTLPEADYVARARHGFMRIRPAALKAFMAPAGARWADHFITLSAGFAEDHPDLAIARAAILVKAATLFENREGAELLGL